MPIDRKMEIQPAEGKLGILLVGLGAVSTTFIAGVEAIKKGFAAACARAGIENLRPYDLRHTFATRLLEQGVHHYVISALLGHATPMMGFGAASRMTPGYAHATWDMMVTAVAMLEQPLRLNERTFGT